MKNDIQDFITKLEQEHELFRYLCNKKDFISGKDTVYYAGPYFDMNEKVAMIESIFSGKWLSAGEKVNEFENKFSEKFGLKYSVMVNSGSSANLIMMSALKKYLNWSDGDEIILSPVGFPTTIAPVIQNNLKPVFIDISMHDLNFDEQNIMAKFTNRTKAIFISPVLGNPPDMKFLNAISKNTGIELILDNCDSLGSKWEGRYLSEYCIASSSSFYPAHHICTGEGGMISTNYTKLYRIIRSLTSWGRACTCVGVENTLPNGSCGKRFGKWLQGYNNIVDHRYIFSNVGYNMKPLDLQGAIGIEQLKKFDKMHEIRRANKESLGKALEEIDGVRVLQELESAETGWFGVGIICENKELKQSLTQYMEQNRIQTRNYFGGNLLMHPAFKNLDDIEHYPNANKVIDLVFFIGCSPTIQIKMVEYIKEIIGKYIGSVYELELAQIG